MIEKTYKTRCGVIHYWTNEVPSAGKPSLLFLPGLTADHRLFDSQIGYFEKDYRVLVWDAPGHAASRPFSFSFDLTDKARWVDEILKAENMTDVVLVGQSMGGYVGQAYMQIFPGKLRGFISIDSAPLQRQYISSAELWMLKRVEPIYRLYPWKSLLKAGSDGVAETAAGKKLMYDMMMVYDGDQAYYSHLTGHGFSMLAKAIEADLPYRIDCPALLICGEQDKAGSARRYNKAWHQKTGIPIEWLAGAGHNANTDEPDRVNQLILRLVEGLSVS